MVLDTKWKKFKYSNGNKLLCVLLALLMVACLMSNVVQLASCLSFYGENVLKQNISEFYDTASFKRMLRENLDSIQYDLIINEKEQEKQAYIDSFYKAYKKAENENRLNKDEVRRIIYTTEEYGDNSDNSYAIGELEDGRKVYEGDDGFYYTQYMLYSNQRLYNANHSDDGINFGHDEETARNMIRQYYDNSISDWCGQEYYGLNYISLKNIQY